MIIQIVFFLYSQFIFFKVFSDEIVYFFSSEGKVFMFLNSGTACSSSQYQCADGSCIHFTFYCDHIKHCNDGSDEQHCRKFNNKPNHCIILF